MGGVLCAQRLSSRRPGGAKARGIRAARSGGAWDGACQARRGRGRHRTAASESLRVPAGKVPLGQLPRRPMEGGVRIDGHVLAGVDDDAQVHRLRPTPSLSPPRLQAWGPPGGTGPSECRPLLDASPPCNHAVGGFEFAWAPALCPKPPFLSLLPERRAECHPQGPRVGFLRPRPL